MTARARLVTLALALGVTAPALADDDAAPTGPKEAAGDLARGQEPNFPKFDAVVDSELESQDGLYPVYHDKKKPAALEQVEAAPQEVELR